MPEIHQFELDNGLKVIVEPMAGVKSAAFSLMVPSGTVHERADQLGVSTLLSEMMLRGAGDLDSRGHSDALDMLGIHRTTEVQTNHLRVGAVLLGERFGEGFRLMMDTVRKPLLEDKEFGPSRDLALQTIESLEDEPQEKAMLGLKKQHLPSPINRSSLGDAEHLQAMTAEDVRDFFKNHVVPEGAILGVAGDVDPKQVLSFAEAELGDWAGRKEDTKVLGSGGRGYHHEESASAQHHIGLAYDTIAASDPERMTQSVVIAIMSGGMSGRLFTEVREKRGLCYSVYATYVAYRECGVIYGYSGTTPERAQETLDVMCEEFKKMVDGVNADEFERAITGLKSRVVMQGESTAARGAALARDQYTLGKPRSLEDIAAEIDAITLERVNAFTKSHAYTNPTVYTIGNHALTI